MPHTCIMYNNLCLGPITSSEFQFEVGDDDTVDMAIETHTTPTRDKEGRAETWTPSITVSLYILLVISLLI